MFEIKLEKKITYSNAFTLQHLSNTNAEQYLDSVKLTMNLFAISMNSGYWSIYECKAHGENTAPF